jgi:hypothetical protein
MDGDPPFSVMLVLEMAWELPEKAKALSVVAQ